MAQKVATARKMKSRQETTPLGQIATVTAKPTFINSDTRRFKIQTGDMGPPPGRASVLTLETSEISAIFVFKNKTTQPRPQVLSVNSALTCKKAALLTSSVHYTKNSSKCGHQ